MVAQRGLAAGLSTALAVAAGILTNVATSGWTWPVVIGFVVLAVAWVGLEVWRAAGEAHRLRTAADRVAEVGADGSQRRSLAPPRGLLPERVHGRGDLLATLSRLAAVPDGRLQVLCGLGGCGKTTVALAVADRAAADRVRVWWITAQDETSLTMDLLSLAMDLGATSLQLRQAQIGIRSLTDLVWAQLETVAYRWMLVVDNADQPELLAAEGGRVGDGNGVVRGSSRGLVLVTSRVSGQEVWGARTVLRPVGPLDHSDGAQVLCDLAPHAGTTSEAAELTARLGGLPLALRAAGRYLGSPRARLDQATTFSVYRRAVDTRFATLLGAVAGSAASREALVTTWELSLDLLTAQGLQHARALMRLVGGFAAAPIPVSVLDGPALWRSTVFVTRTAEGPQPKHLMIAAWTRLRAIPGGGPGRYGTDLHRRTIEALCDLGLLELTPGGTGPAASICLAAHPLVSEVNAAWLTDHRPLARAVHRTVAALLSQATHGRDPFDAGEYATWRLLAPHLAYCLTFAAALPRTAVAALVDAANVTAHGLIYAGDLLAGHALAETSIAAAMRHLPTEHPSGLEARLELAFALLERGMHQQAEAELTAALPAFERVLGVDSPNTIRARHDRADAIGRQGRYKQAEDKFRAVRSASEQTLGIDHRRTLTARHNIADMMGRQGLHQEAEDEFRAVLAAQRRTLGTEHRNTLHTLHHLANLLLQQGRYEQAEAECRAALPTLQRVLGPENLDTLRLRHTLANVLARRGLSDDAETEYRAVLDARTRVLGVNHPDTADIRSALEQLRACAPPHAAAADEISPSTPSRPAHGTPGP